MSTTMIKNASKVSLRQLNVPQQRRGHLVLGGGHPEWSRCKRCSRCSETGWNGLWNSILPAPNTLRSNPGKPTALSHLWRLMVPAQHTGREKKFTQQTNLLKNWKYLLNRSTLIKVTPSSNYSPSPGNYTLEASRLLLTEYWWKAYTMSRCTILGVLISEVASNFSPTLSVFIWKSLIPIQTVIRK